jgi:periplasmic protein CpxP/Spy
MNRLFLSTSLALALCSTVVFSQQETVPPPPSKHHHAHNPQRETARLTKKLNLTSDQSAKLGPILADRDQKITALSNDTTISPMIAKKQIHAIHQQTRQQLATVLTPDQLQQMRALRRHGHGAPAQTQPQTQPQTNPQSGL